MINRLSIIAAVVMLQMPASDLLAQKGIPAKVVVTTTVTTKFPQHLEFSDKLLTNLKCAAGYKIVVAAKGLGKPRMMAMSDAGNLYITRRDQNDVLVLSGKNSEGEFQDLKTVLSNFKGVHGITIKDGYMYLCSNGELIKAAINPDGSLQAARTILKNLPDGGQHGNRYIKFGPDGKLYMSIGSSCNDCGETNPEHATIIQTDTAGGIRKIYARGLRNTIGFDWNPETKEMWGLDNGTDWRGDEIPPEELNKIVENADYGWPLVYGNRQIDETREDPPGGSKEKYAATTQPSVLTFPAHSAPIDFLFLNASSPFNGDGLVTWHGSWNREKPQGFKIQRIKFQNGTPTTTEDFFWGFFDASANTRFGRPTGLLQDSKGNIFVSDDANGIIYCLSPEKK